MLAFMRSRSLLFVPSAVLALGLACTNTVVVVDDDAPTPDDVVPLPTDPDEPDDDVDLGPRPVRPPSPFVPSPARLRRLLQLQYTNGVADLLGDAAAAASSAPPDVPLNGSVAVGAGDLALDAAALVTYEASARAAAAAAVADPSSPWRAVCAPSSATDAACWQDLARRLGRRAFRRTLADDEVARYAALGQQAAVAYGNIGEPRAVDRGVELLLVALLQSPHFLYLVERGEPGDDPAARRLTGAELAARLSFFLTGAPPDDELLDAAERGDLSSPTVLSATARALLTDPRAKDALRGYFVEKLHLADLPALNRPDAALTPSVRAALVEETLRLVDDVVWTRNADVRDLLRSTDTFVNDELASYYGFPLPGAGATFVKVPTPAEQDRAGLLTRGAFLVRFAQPDRSSPTLRGKFVREQLLCAAVPAPPPGVATTLPDEVPDGLPRTTRDRIEAHAREDSCAGCHAYIDPLGYPFEHFDQYGRYRTHENGLPIDASGGLDDRTSEDATGFIGLLDERVDLVSCLVRGLYRHAVGRMEESGQDAALYDVDSAFIDGGLKLQDAMVAIATSDAFRFVDTTDGE
ncbi:MAG: DUF1588 domain-containing protein [Deltaproteobacteria bacterium]|nr:DUF1588 domain-containing protein [Deltaproteobacteria bacterium]